MAIYPKELAQDAAYQSYTNRLIRLWSLPIPALWLNSSNINNCYTNVDDEISTSNRSIP
jgi:hypothetical protein